MLDNLEPGWLWMIGGILLLIAEIIAPGFFLVFIGAAALATGAFTLLFGLGTRRAAHPVRALCARRRDDRPARLRECADRQQRPASQRSRRAPGRARASPSSKPVDEHGGRVRVGDSEWSARGGPGSAWRARSHNGG